MNLWGSGVGWSILFYQDFLKERHQKSEQHVEEQISSGIFKHNNALVCGGEGFTYDEFTVFSPFVVVPKSIS